MVAYEEATGRSLLGGEDSANMSAKELFTLVWASLIHEDKELTLDMVLDMVEVGDIPRLNKAISQCIVESRPDKGDGKDAPLA